MAEAGVFGPDERIELLDGEVVEMASIGPPHSSRVDRCAHHLWRTIATGVIVRVQNPLHLSDLSMPEPDVTVLRHRDDFYGTRHPTVADVLLLIEVGDTSARFDREVKLPLYATAAVVEVWLLDVQARTVSVCTDPHEGTYQSIVQAGPGRGPPTHRSAERRHRRRRPAGLRSLLRDRGPGCTGWGHAGSAGGRPGRTPRRRTVGRRRSCPRRRSPLLAAWPSLRP